MNITGNTILITSGTSGIGKQMAIEFAGLGNEVIVVGRDKAKLKDITCKNARISGFVCDISKQDDRDHLLVKMTNDYPQLNVVINNAGVQNNYQFQEETIPFTRIEMEIDINFTGLVCLSSMFIPFLITQTKAAIVNVSSALAYAPKQNAAVYCATKAAVHSFTQSLRYQLEDTSIRVFELIPPLVDTPMTAGRGKRKASPKDVVDALLVGLKNNKFEIHVGKVKLLRVLKRLFPAVVKSILRNG